MSIPIRTHRQISPLLVARACWPQLYITPSSIPYITYSLLHLITKHISLFLSLYHFGVWILVFVRKWLSSFMDFPCLHAPLVCWPASMRKVQILSLFRLTFSVGNTNSLLFYLRMYVLSTSNLVVFYLLALDFILLNLHAFVDTQFLVFKLVYNIFLGKKKKKKKNCSPLVRFQCQKMVISLFLVSSPFIFLTFFSFSATLLFYSGL